MSGYLRFCRNRHFFIFKWKEQIFYENLSNSTGSGKRALLEVISRRTHGPTRGQVLLDNSPTTIDLFHRTCGYVSHHTELISTLSVEQTIHYAASFSIGPQV